jgi:hypothetical protein
MFGWCCQVESFLHSHLSVKGQNPNVNGLGHEDAAAQNDGLKSMEGLPTYWSAHTLMERPLTIF